MLSARAEGSCFNPRSPRGGATWYHILTIFCTEDVSIHAPHEGERPCPILPFAALYRFQSTLPTRGSDVPYCSIYGEIQEFQSTLPTRGSDISFAMRAKQRRMSFNPRSPRGGATI